MRHNKDLLLIAAVLIVAVVAALTYLPPERSIAAEVDENLAQTLQGIDRGTGVDYSSTTRSTTVGSTR